MNLDYAVLTAGKELADLSGRTLGQVLPDLIRTALSAGREETPEAENREEDLVLELSEGRGGHEAVLLNA
jgi:hypothetical protein